MKHILLGITLGIGVVALGGCSQEGMEPAELSKESIQYSEFDVNVYKLNSLVCDPMGGNGTVGLGGGLKAELFYTNGTNYDVVQDYFDNGTRANYDLFYSELNVPTRRFELGFPTQSGTLVKDDSGHELNEYFALKFRTVLTLGEANLPGRYEFAVLSDDGTIIRYRNADGELAELINNDGDHPTRMGCSSTTIDMDYGTKLEVEVDYYQGPRYHISLVPLWRRIDGERESESLCGQKGNSLFFDYNNNSEPQQAYLDLMDRGWQVWSAENYNLPQEEEFNPCFKGEVPTITEFSVIDNYDGVISVRWHTELPATTQVRIVDIESGEETITDSDNVLRKDHSESLIGLVPGKSYLIQGVSISESYGKELSEAVVVTPRYN